LDATLLLHSVGMWLVFLVLAIVNGSARNFLYAKKTGEHKGHVISSLIAISYILAGTYLFVNAVASVATLTDLLLVGGFWLTVTVVFEFGFGHYVMKHSWSHLLADYNLLKGRLWSLVLLTSFVAPVFWGLLILS
jgi:hypothetical protein